MLFFKEVKQKYLNQHNPKETSEHLFMQSMNHDPKLYMMGYVCKEYPTKPTYVGALTQPELGASPRKMSIKWNKTKQKTLSMAQEI